MVCQNLLIPNLFEQYLVDSFICLLNIQKLLLVVHRHSLPPRRKLLIIFVSYYYKHNMSAGVLNYFSICIVVYWIVDIGS